MIKRNRFIKFMLLGMTLVIAAVGLFITVVVVAEYLDKPKKKYPLSENYTVGGSFDVEVFFDELHLPDHLDSTFYLNGPRGLDMDVEDIQSMVVNGRSLDPQVSSGRDLDIYWAADIPIQLGVNTVDALLTFSDGSQLAFNSEYINSAETGDIRRIDFNENNNELILVDYKTKAILGLDLSIGYLDVIQNNIYVKNNSSFEWFDLAVVGGELVTFLWDRNVEYGSFYMDRYDLSDYHHLETVYKEHERYSEPEDIIMLSTPDLPSRVVVDLDRRKFYMLNMPNAPEIISIDMTTGDTEKIYRPAVKSGKTGRFETIDIEGLSYDTLNQSLVVVNAKKELIFLTPEGDQAKLTGKRFVMAENLSSLWVYGLSYSAIDGVAYMVANDGIYRYKLSNGVLEPVSLELNNEVIRVRDTVLDQAGGRMFVLTDKQYVYEVSLKTGEYKIIYK